MSLAVSHLQRDIVCMSCAVEVTVENEGAGNNYHRKL